MGYHVIIEFQNPVDGRNPAPVDIVNIILYSQGFIHIGWCRISSINLIAEYMSRVLQENDAVRLNGVPPHFEAVRQVIFPEFFGW